MAKETGVPKLKGQSNCRQWYIRLRAYMMDKGSWDAVRFVPYKRGDSQRIESTPSPEDRTGDDAASQTEQQSGPKDIKHYADLPYDEGLTKADADEWIY